MLSRDLSHGHFSEDNQKRLVGSNLDVPVFEAKMTGDTRLVVSCIRCASCGHPELVILAVYGGLYQGF